MNEKQIVKNYAQINIMGKVSQITLGRDGRTMEGLNRRQWIC